MPAPNPRPAGPPAPPAAPALVPAGARPRHAPAPLRPAPAVSVPGALRALRRHWFRAFGLGTLAGVAVAAAAWLLLRPAPTVRGLLLVEPNPPKVAFKTADNE